MSNHISELCLKGDVDAIAAYLLKVGGGDEVTDAGTKEDIIRAASNRQDDEGRTVLHWALSVKASAVVAKLLEPPFSCTAATVDQDGVTPLMTACAAGVDVQTLELIMKTIPADFTPPPTSSTQDSAGGAPPQTGLVAYINMKDHVGNSALIAAGSRGHAATINLLLTAGADFKAQNKRGQSALHRAVSRGSAEAVDALVVFAKKSQQHRPMINLQDVQGNAALHYAAMENNQELGEVLLRSGALRELKNKEGKEFWQL